MKEYFKHKSKLPEYVQMRRIAIKKMRLDGATDVQIAEVLSISKQAVGKLRRQFKPIDEEIELKFHFRVAMRFYPVFEKKRIAWKRLK